MICDGCKQTITPEFQALYGEQCVCCLACLKKAEDEIATLRAYIKKLEWRLGYVGL